MRKSQKWEIGSAVGNNRRISLSLFQWILFHPDDKGKNKKKEKKVWADEIGPAEPERPSSTSTTTRYRFAEQSGTRRSERHPQPSPNPAQQRVGETGERKVGHERCTPTTTTWVETGAPTRNIAFALYNHTGTLRHKIRSGSPCPV